MPCKYIEKWKGIRGKCVVKKAMDAGQASAKTKYDTICMTEKYVDCPLYTMKKEAEGKHWKIQIYF